MSADHASDALDRDPSLVSHYVTPAYYGELRAAADVWAGPLPPADDGLRPVCEALLSREARLLDEGRFEEWLALFVPECLYWIPVTPGGGHPEREVTIAFDDRRRLEDRVVWLRNAFIWSQIPKARTVRAITNTEVVEDPSGDLLVRSVFTIHEVRGGKRDAYAGWYAHRLRGAGDELRIVSKQVNLVDSDIAHSGSSILF